MAHGRVAVDYYSATERATLRGISDMGVRKERVDFLGALFE